MRVAVDIEAYGVVIEGTTDELRALSLTLADAADEGEAGGLLFTDEGVTPVHARRLGEP